MCQPILYLSLGNLKTLHDHKLPDRFEIKLFLPKSLAANFSGVMLASLLVLLGFVGGSGSGSGSTNSGSGSTVSGSGSSGTVSFLAPSLVQIQVQRHFSSCVRFITYFGHLVLGQS